MRYSVHALVLCILLCVATGRDATAGSTRWQAPFDTAESGATTVESVLTLDEVLRLVANKNPILKALEYERLAAAGNLRQAGLWPNPEFEAEFEEIGWDAPGLSESELTLALSQELELFGQRGARKRLAQTQAGTVDFESDVRAFDLYLEVKHRFYTVAHAQEALRLAEASLRLANDIAENISYRIGKGAGLHSELLLAQIEQQRAQLNLEQQKQLKATAEANLVALWETPSTPIAVIAEREPELTALLRMAEELTEQVDSTRTITHLRNQSAVARAEYALSRAEMRPSVTLSGGVKHLEATNTKSLVFGISLPLPLFNRNQGTRESIAAKLRSLDHQIESQRFDASAALQTHLLGLRNLIQRHDMLDEGLLPTAEAAYQSLHDAYESGRIPYTQLLEVERSLNELRNEHNDMLLELHQRTIELERLTGVTLRIDKEN